MPLRKGGSEKAISYNIAELLKTGRSREQSIAIAESEARKTSKKKRETDARKERTK